MNGIQATYVVLKAQALRGRSKITGRNCASVKGCVVKGKVATYITYDPNDESVAIRYHWTDVITFYLKRRYNS